MIAARDLDPLAVVTGLKLYDRAAGPERRWPELGIGHVQCELRTLLACHRHTPREAIAEQRLQKSPCHNEWQGP